MSVRSIRRYACTIALMIASPAAAQELLSISAAIEMARARNVDLELAQYDLSLAVEAYRLGITQYLPTLTLDYTTNDSVSFNAPDNRFRTLSVGVSQPIYQRGSVVQGRRIQRAQVDLQRRQLDVQRDAIGRQVLQLFSQILRTRETAEILMGTLDIAERQVAIAREELAVGEITRLDLIELELQETNVRIRIQETNGEEQDLRYELAQILEMPLDQLPDVQGTLRSRYASILASRDPSFYLEAADRFSIEQREATLSVAQAREQLRLARTVWLPAITADVEVGATGESFPLTEPTASLALSFAWDLPLAPTTVDASLQRTLPDDRSRTLATSVSPGANVDALQSRRGARVGLRRQSEIQEDLVQQLEFFVRSELDGIDRLVARRRLLIRQQELESERQQVEAILLDQGQLRRVDFLESEIERAEQEIQLLDAVVTQFNAEIELLARIGMPDLAAMHQAIIAPDENR